LIVLRVISFANLLYHILRTSVHLESAHDRKSTRLDYFSYGRYSKSELNNKDAEMDDRYRALEKIAKKFSVEGIYAFGSAAKEALDWVSGKKEEMDFGFASDLDIGIKPQPATKLNVHQKVKLTIALEDLFSAPRVDLVVIPEADPFLAANIIRGERLYVENEYLADEYDLYILRKAGDCAYLERERIALILGDGK